MRPSKADTVKNFLERFLQGRSVSYSESFLQRPLEKQYTAIMNWRRRNKDAADAPVATGATKIVSHLRSARKVMERSEALTPAHVASVERELNAFRQYVDDYRQNLNHRRIAELELKRSELDRQIEELRGAVQNT